MKLWIVTVIVIVAVVIAGLVIWLSFKKSSSLNCTPWTMPSWSQSIAYGTYNRKGSRGTKLVSQALDAGFRIIDNAMCYGNEEEVGAIIRESKIPRGEMVLITKVPPSHIGRMEEKLATTAELYGTSYMDVYMLHDQPDHFEDTIAAWKRLLRLHDKGKVKLVGMTNVSQAILEKLGKATGKLPMIIENSLRSVEDLEGSLANFCKKYGIVRLYFGVTKERNLTHPNVVTYARSHNISPHCAILRIVQEAGAIPVVGSANERHIIDNWRCVYKGKQEQD